MASRRIVYCFRKQHRTGGVDALGNELVIESARVIYPARTDRVDDGASRPQLRVGLESSVRQSVICGRRAHQRKRSRTTQARLTTGLGDEFFRNRHVVIFATIHSVGQRFARGFISSQKLSPGGRRVRPERGDGSDPLNKSTHIARNNKDALVPPKPKELESTVRIDAERDWLATTSNFQVGSGSLK